MREAGTTSRSYSEPVSAIRAFCMCEHPGKTAAQPGQGCSLLPLPATLSLSASGATLCPQVLCHRSNGWIFPLQKHCHGKYPPHLSPLDFLESALQAWLGGTTHLVTTADVAVKTHEPHSENVDQTPHALPSRPAASGSGSPAGTLALGNFPGIPGFIFCLRKLISYPLPPPFTLSRFCSWHSL